MLRMHSIEAKALRNLRHRSRRKLRNFPFDA